MRAVELQVLTFTEQTIPAELRQQVIALEEQAWPTMPPSEPHGHDPMLSPICMLLVADGRVVSSLAILSKEIAHGGQKFDASGLSAVVTDNAERNRGYGLRLVAAAREAIRAGGADLGIFTCDPPLVGFYEHAGWQVLPGTVLVGGTPDSPLPSDRLGKIALGDFFTKHAKRYAASFRRARVELYPGNVDKLW
jgi:aminoglycoside 2'-N-acetyltransferase I